jgi:hypothetical protein
MGFGCLAYPGPWQREGRGLRADVEGLTAEAVEGAISSLPPDWGPYRLLAVTKRQEGRHSVEVVRVVEGAQLDDSAAECQWNYFLWSPSLTPELNESLETEYVDPRAAGVLSLSGLVSMQYRPKIKGREHPSGIGCVHRIAAESGGVVLHEEYEKIYRALLRQLRKNGT